MVKPGRTLSFLLAAIGLAAIGAGSYLFLTARKTEVICGENATDVHGLKIFGPYVIRANRQPTIAFTINECTGPGYTRNILFVVIVDHPNNAKFTSKLSCGTRHSVDIFNDIMLGFDENEVHVIHNTSLNSLDGEPAYYADGTFAPLWQEEIDFYLMELPGMETLTFNLERGRTFVVRFENGSTEVRQLDTKLFNHESIDQMEFHAITNRVYLWWRDTNPD